ncbi:MAG: ribonuclease H [Saprospiraceae bacterium]|nr:ribonuclease H [Saprospiraceae bacterium]
MAKSQKYYVVWSGRTPGIYNNWETCQIQINGFPNAKYESFSTLAEAQIAFNTPPVAVGKSTKSSPKIENRIIANEPVIWESIAVDAACSGNPGVMEYQGVDTKTGKQLFHQKFNLGTNNIGEFLGIVHGLGYLEKLGARIPIYSDSKTAIGWVKKGQSKSKLVVNEKTEYLHELIKRAENWLATHDFRVPVLKWETEKWGEIPADFGRK